MPKPYSTYTLSQWLLTGAKSKLAFAPKTKWPPPDENQLAAALLN